MGTSAIEGTRRKRRGEGEDPVVTFRLAPDRVAQLDLWAMQRGLTRSEALRMLVGLALDDRAA